MKKPFSLLAALLFSVGMMAETYTIVFNSGSTIDYTKESSDLNSLVYDATDHCILAINSASKVYRAKEGYGIKGGTSSIGGNISFQLDDTYHISSMTVYAASFAHKNDTTSTKGITVCGQNFKWETGYRTQIRPYTFSLDKDIEEITISSGVDSYNRWYVQKIEFEAPNPHPTRAIINMQYAALNLGSISWESEDEPMEDAIGVEITGRNIEGDISLSLKKLFLNKLIVLNIMKY